MYIIPQCRGLNFIHGSARLPARMRYKLPPLQFVGVLHAGVELKIVRNDVVSQCGNDLVYRLRPNILSPIAHRRLLLRLSRWSMPASLGRPRVHQRRWLHEQRDMFALRHASHLSRHAVRPMTLSLALCAGLQRMNKGEYLNV